MGAFIISIIHCTNSFAGPFRPTGSPPRSPILAGDQKRPCVLVSQPRRAFSDQVSPASQAEDLPLMSLTFMTLILEICEFFCNVVPNSFYWHDKERIYLFSVLV